MTCPECARREAEIAAMKRRDAAWNGVFLHIFAGVMALGAIWEVIHGRWPTNGVMMFGVLATAVYLVWGLHSAIAWLVRRRRARRRTP